jgi:3-phenylpropionate/trans-cinnamate dioxygenase ferredoxin reductase subunit
MRSPMAYRDGMTDTHRLTIVIVGAGMAGGRAAMTLRKEGYEGRIVLVGDEPRPPYERPPLSKHYLRGEQAADALAIAPREGGWEGARVELRTGTHVARLDIAASEVELDGGERISYDRALLATGSEPRSLIVPGADLDGVLMLRTLDDADRIRAAISAGGRIAIVGGGWIGGEVAACARQLGADVVLLTGSAGLLERQLGPEVSGIYTDLHRRHGVDVRSGAQASAIEGSGGRVSGVRLSDGTIVGASAVVVGIGASPRLDLAREAGLEVGAGVRVDPLFRTSAPGVFAVGDVAEAWHPLVARHVRLDHWAAAWFGGPAAAKSMLDEGSPYERVPYLYSDQYDLSMESWGVPPAWDRVVVRGDAAAGSFLAFWLHGGRVVGAMLGNQPEARKQLEPLVRLQVPADPARLADPAISLDDPQALAGESRQGPECG